MVTPFPLIRQLSPAVLDTKTIQTNLVPTHNTFIIIIPLNFIYLFIFLWIFYLHAYLCISCVTGAHRSQKKGADHLGPCGCWESNLGPLEEHCS